MVGRGGSRGGRGRGSHTADPESRKRRSSDERSSQDADDEAKRRKTEMGNKGEVEVTSRSKSQDIAESAIERVAEEELGAAGGGVGVRGEGEAEVTESF